MHSDIIKERVDAKKYLRGKDMETNMACMLEYLLTEAEKGGRPPASIIMNSRSLEAFSVERTANGECVVSTRWFGVYQIVVDESLSDYEILLPGWDESEPSNA